MIFYEIYTTAYTKSPLMIMPNIDDEFRQLLYPGDVYRYATPYVWRKMLNIPADTYNYKRAMRYLDTTK